MLPIHCQRIHLIPKGWIDATYTQACIDACQTTKHWQISSGCQHASSIKPCCEHHVWYNATDHMRPLTGDFSSALTRDCLQQKIYQTHRLVAKRCNLNVLNVVLSLLNWCVSKWRFRKHFSKTKQLNLRYFPLNIIMSGLIDDEWAVV